MTINEFQSLSEDEKYIFYQKVINENNQIKNKEVKYISHTPSKKNAISFTPGYHQKQGRLSYVQRLVRKGDASLKAYCLCLCDCGNWYITRQDSFSNGDKGISKGGALSCGCLNNEKRAIILGSEIAELHKAEAIRQRYLESGQTPLVGDKINGWTLTASEMRLTPSGDKKRRYIKGLCPYCKKETDWIRYDGIADGSILSCGKHFLEGGVSKSVQKIIEILDNNNIEYITEKTFDTCINPKTNKKLRFDFYINNEYLLEYDGEQHFKISFNGTEADLKENQERDKIKNIWCKENNIPLIRIPYTLKLQDINLKHLKLETSEYIVK